MDINYYRVLQVDPAAEPEVIKAAYKRLAFKYHPDVNSSPQASDQMRVINEAYEVLSNPVKRSQYDQVLAHTTHQQAAEQQRRAQAEAARQAAEQQRRAQAEAARQAAEQQRRAQAEAARQAADRQSSSIPTVQPPNAITLPARVRSLVSRTLQAAPALPQTNNQWFATAIVGLLECISRLLDRIPDRISRFFQGVPVGIIGSATFGAILGANAALPIPFSASIAWRLFTYLLAATYGIAVGAIAGVVAALTAALMLRAIAPAASLPLRFLGGALVGSGAVMLFLAISGPLGSSMVDLLSPSRLDRSFTSAMCMACGGVAGSLAVLKW